MCTLCRDEIPLTDHNYDTENALDQVFFGRIDIKKAAALLYFEEHGIVKNLIHNLKYKGQQQIGGFLGEWFGSRICSLGIPEIDLVVPVPLHPKKLKKRGYNQVEEFGKHIASCLHAAFDDSILLKSRNTPTQTTKNRWHRWVHQMEEYQVQQPGLIEGKRILLVDDVVTTGATVESCSKALHNAKGVEIYLGVMAYVA